MSEADAKYWADISVITQGALLPISVFDKAVYNSWQRDLAYFIVKHKIADHWHGLREFYHTAFAKHVDQMIEQQRKATRNTAPTADV